MTPMMRALEAAQLLEVRERGRELPPGERALLLLETASPDIPRERIASLPVGMRDARLVELRARTLGPVFQSEARCPECDERLELDLPVEELRAAAGTAGGPPEIVTVRQDGYRVVVRLPTGRDLVEVDGRDAEGTGTGLLARCLVEAELDGSPVAPAELPPDVIEAVGEAVTEADPLVDIRLDLACAVCGHAWTSAFDPVAFFWGEIEAWAPRLLREVHRLASAYGWSEAEILGMSAWRRGQYLQLLGR